MNAKKRLEEYFQNIVHQQNNEFQNFIGNEATIQSNGQYKR